MAPRRRYAERTSGTGRLDGTFGDEDREVADMAAERARYENRLSEEYRAGEDDRDAARQELADDATGDLRDRQRSGRIVTGPIRPSQGAGDTAGGFILGLLAWTLALNYFRGGLPAVRGWVGAKFVNRPYTGALKNLPPDVKPARPNGPG